jgi:hypothetical protein
MTFRHIGYMTLRHVGYMTHRRVAYVADRYAGCVFSLINRWNGESLCDFMVGPVMGLLLEFALRSNSVL